MTKCSSSKRDSPAEARRKRTEAVDFARASIGLSGFIITSAHEARAQCFINGEISLEEFVDTPNESSK